MVYKAVCCTAACDAWCITCFNGGRFYSHPAGSKLTGDVKESFSIKLWQQQRVQQTEGSRSVFLQVAQLLPHLIKCSASSSGSLKSNLFPNPRLCVYHLETACTDLEQAGAGTTHWDLQYSGFCVLPRKIFIYTWNGSMVKLVNQIMMSVNVWLTNQV